MKSSNPSYAQFFDSPFLLQRYFQGSHMTLNAIFVSLSKPQHKSNIITTLNISWQALSLDLLRSMLMLFQKVYYPLKLCVWMATPQNGIVWKASTPFTKMANWFSFPLWHPCMAIGLVTPVDVCCAEWYWIKDQEWWNTDTHICNWQDA